MEIQIIDDSQVYDQVFFLLVEDRIQKIRNHPIADIVNGCSNNTPDGWIYDPFQKSFFYAHYDPEKVGIN